MTAIPIQSTDTTTPAVFVPAPRVPIDTPQSVAEPTRSMRNVRDHNGIYHSNAGRGVMRVVLTITLAAWVVLVGGIILAGLVL